MMKKTYQAPVTEIVELNVIDTVATSGEKIPATSRPVTDVWPNN